MTRQALISGSPGRSVYVNETAVRQAVTAPGCVDETSPPPTPPTPFDRAPYFTYLEM